MFLRVLSLHFSGPVIDAFERMIEEECQERAAIEPHYPEVTHISEHIDRHEFEAYVTGQPNRFQRPQRRRAGVIRTMTRRALTKRSNRHLLRSARRSIINPLP